MSGQLTWSHYLELLKCDDPLEMQFYMKECIKEGHQVQTAADIIRDPFVLEFAGICFRG